MGEVATSPAGEQAARLLWRGADVDMAPRVFFLIDAARDRGIYPALRRLAATEPVAALYEGRSARELAGVAPYLLALDPNSPGFDWVWQQPVRAGWGIFIRAPIAIGALRAHLRRLTRVRLEDGRIVLFRFYDPRVLAAFAPTCDAAQMCELFGPIDTLFAVPAVGRMEAFSPSDGGVRHDVHAIG